MKSQKGISHIVLSIIVIIIAFIIFTGIFFLMKYQKLRLIDNYQTNMLQIQGKVTIIAQEANMQDKDELLIGRKVEDKQEIEKIKSLLEEGVISKDEEKFSKYYIIDGIELEEMKLENINIGNGFYIVNYDTGEVIYSDGIEYEGNIYYKLSELKKLDKNEESISNEIQENVTEENTEEETEGESEE